MTDYEVELERRRERGRLAQSAFRKRQAQSKKLMEEENCMLKQAIATLVAEVRDDDRLALRVKIQDAAKIAGLEGDLHHDSTSTSSSESRVLVPSSTQVRDNDVAQKDSNNSFPIHSPKQVLSPHLTQDPMPVASRQIHCESIRKDPFQVQKYRGAIISMLPFLGPGAWTFAGRIFWHLVERVDNAAHNSGSAQLPEPPAAETMAPPKLQDLLGQTESWQNADPAHWFAMVEARLEYCRQESTCNYIARGPSASLPEGYSLWLEPESREASALGWLSLVSAEKRIRAAVGDEVFAALAAPLLAYDRTGETGQRGGNNIELIHGLLDRLCESYVCFGDGPYWNIETFDMVLKDWCHSTMNS